MYIKSLLASGAALALVACGDGAEETDPTAQDGMAEPAMTAEVAPDPAADPAMPTNAQQFVTMQAASDAYEIEAGRMAQDNATGQEVKDFGAMMVEDHTTSTRNLRDAAQQAEGVTVDPQMTAEQQANLDALRNAGDNFDRVYLDQQVAAHEKALAMLRNYGEGGDTPSLRQFASQTAGVVEGHFEEARQLQGQAQQR